MIAPTRELPVETTGQPELSDAAAEAIARLLLRLVEQEMAEEAVR